MDYILHLAILICIYTILSQSLSLVAGYSGQMSLAHAGFYGIGAYVAALLSVNLGLPPVHNLVAAMLLSGFVAYIVSKVAVRTIEDYYIIITLGIQVVIYSIMNNWQSVTNGPLGIAGIPSFSIFGYSFDNKLSFLLLSGTLAALVWLLLSNIMRSPFGRILRALSEDEVYTKSLGKNVAQAKVVSFVISGMLASIAGVLYAHYISYIDPSSFTIDESIFILSIVIIGGMRNLRNIFFASVFLVLLPEALRFVGMPSSIAANMRQIIYGIALVLVIYKLGLKK
ncbi:MAG: branched-chain amino acid ABC transporter permease [Prevotella sp.]|nr:branched-chain amino acid ABC transporter permease [Prevotella sp.]